MEFVNATFLLARQLEDAENSLEGGYHGQFIHKFAFSLAEQRDGQNRREIWRWPLLNAPHGDAKGDEARAASVQYVRATL
jgi:hypothetical protein